MHSRLRNRCGWLSALALLLGASAAAQLPADTATRSEQRSRIGLVLSGGGARGGAHIGVLRALEELRVPVDVIAGTSIGAAVGGFYASGMDSTALDEFVASIDWTAAFTNTTPRELKPFRRKQDDYRFLVEQRPGLNEGEFELPTGVVQGQVIDMFLSRATFPVAQVRDFDELSIPFRAVAADLATGDAVVLGSGSLARAIRASMSVPAAIAPTEIDGRILVDGGVAMNLPVEVAQSMGADVIIAVDITSDLLDQDALRSVFNVTSQLTNLLTRQTVGAQRELLDENDILLTPSFSSDLSSASFTRLAETIDAGYEVVMERRADFESLALGETEYAAYRAGLPDPRGAGTPVVDFVRVDNQSNVADSIVDKRLEDIRVGEPFDRDVVERAINRAYGLDLFQSVRYDLAYEDGRTGLDIDLVARPWGPNYLQFGLGYSSATQEDAIFGVSLSYLRTAINSRGGEWRATLGVGDEPRFGFDFYQPLGDIGMFFIAPSFGVGSQIFNVYEDNSIVSELNVRQTRIALAGGRDLEDWGEVRAGYRYGEGNTRLRVGDPALVYDDFDVGEMFTRFSVDTLNDVSFPRSGLLSVAEWVGSRESLAATADFDQFLFDLLYAKTWGRHTLLTTLRYDTTLSGAPPIASQFRMGGLFDLPGLNRNQLTGQQAARAGLVYYRRIGDLALFPAFAGVSVEAGNVWDDRSDIGDSMIVAGSLWAGVDTPVGPVYLGYGRADIGEGAFYVVLGRIF